MEDHEAKVTGMEAAATKAGKEHEAAVSKMTKEHEAKVADMKATATKAKEEPGVTVFQNDRGARSYCS